MISNLVDIQEGQLMLQYYYVSNSNKRVVTKFTFQSQLRPNQLIVSSPFRGITPHYAFSAFDWRVR